MSSVPRTFSDLLQTLSARDRGIPGKYGKYRMFGVHSTQSQVEAAADEMKSQEFRNTDFSVLFSGNDGSKVSAHEMHTTAPEGIDAGGMSGALLGGALAWLAGIEVPYIRGIWPFITAGLFIGALSGTGMCVALGRTEGSIDRHG